MLVLISSFPLLLYVSTVLPPSTSLLVSILPSIILISKSNVLIDSCPSIPSISLCLCKVSIIAVLLIFPFPTAGPAFPSISSWNSVLFRTSVSPVGHFRLWSTPSLLTILHFCLHFVSTFYRIHPIGFGECGSLGLYLSGCFKYYSFL